MALNFESGDSSDENESASRKIPQEIASIASRSTRVSRSVSVMEEADHQQPVREFLEERRSAPKTRIPEDFGDEEQEWKSRQSTVDNRKSVLSRLLSRQKSLRGEGMASTQDRQKHTIGLNMVDSDEENNDSKNNKGSSFPQREKLRSYLLQTRTGLPSKEVKDSVRQQHVQHYDMEMMRRMDADAFADISARIGKQCAHVLASPDVDTIQRVCSHAQANLASFGISQVQLWSDADGAGDNIESSSPDGTAMVLRLPHVLKALQMAKEEGAYGAYSADGGGDVPGLGIRIATLRPDDLSWDEMERAMRVVAGEGSSSSSSSSSSNYRNRDAPTSKKWYAIHMVSPAES